MTVHVMSRVLHAGRFTEAQAATVVQQLLSGVSYLHAHGICHRDIKVRLHRQLLQ